MDADDDDELRAGISFADGKVVITPAPDAREIPGLVFVTTLYGDGEPSRNMPKLKESRSREIELDPFPASPGRGFYRAEVGIDAGRP
jgi:hypothetical protein